MSADLRRVTVNLYPRAATALDKAVDRTGDSTTDTINRALGLYDWVTARTSEGASLVMRHPDGREETAVLL